MGCAAGRPRQLPLCLGPFPSLLWQPLTPQPALWRATPTCFPSQLCLAQTQLASPTLSGKISPMGFSFPQPQREVQSVYLNAGTLGLAFWPGVRQLSLGSMLFLPVSTEAILACSASDGSLRCLGK